MNHSIIYIIDHFEGGYVNDPADSGGETKYGISKKQFPNLDIKNLTKDEAVAIYAKQYWNALWEELPDALAFKFLDCSILHGRGTTAQKVQQILNADGARLKVDSSYGKLTHAALLVALGNGWQNFYDDFIEAFITRIEDIIIKNPKNERFRNGWERRLRTNPYLKNLQV